jgi:nucleoid-associated protein YgaU
MRKTIKQHSVVLIAVSVSLVLSTGTPNFAQSVADAARQERERKRELALHAQHVYTNEDLSKPRILVPEDEARVAARQKDAPGAAGAITAQVATPDPAPSVPAALIEIPDIKDVATTPYLPVATDGPRNVMLPADVSKTPPQAAIHYPQLDISAPMVVDQASSNPIVIPSASADGAARMMLPTTVSKPLAKETTNRVHPQAPVSVGEIRLPATTMPFSTPMGYGPASIALPATVATPLAKEVVHRAQTEVPVPTADINIPAIALPFSTPVAYSVAKVAVPAPITLSVARKLSRETTIEATAPGVAAAVATAPIRLSLAEHSIVRPEASMIAPAEVLVPTDVRSDLAKAVPSLVARVFGPNRSQAIVDATGRVKVGPGDSLWKLAERYFGNGSRWKRLAALNPQLSDPNRILVGEWIQIPSERKQSAKHVVIQPGDTLWSLARTELGSPLALYCLAHANPKLRSVDLVLAGETLVVPPTCGDLGRTQN